MHDTVIGLHATLRKEDLQKETEYKIQKGGKILAEDDNTHWISIWRIWRPHTEKDKNTGSLPYKLHERQGY